MSTERLIPLEEAAYLLGNISVRELNRWIARGRLKRIKLGRSTKLLFSEVQSLIEELKQSA